MEYNNIYITWEQFGEYVGLLVNKILPNKNKYDGIYAIPEGGNILGATLGYILELPVLKKPTNKSLICDDISDTGKTLYKYVKKHDIVTLFSSLWTISPPTYYVLFKTSQKDWLIFPWEELKK